MACQLKVEVMQVRGIADLKLPSIQASDPYVEVRVGAQYRHTAHRNRGDFDPVWNETLDFNIGSPEDEVVTFVLWGQHHLGAHVMAASCSCALAGLVDGATVSRDLKLQRSSLDEAHSGSATISVKFTAMGFSGSKVQSDVQSGFVEDKDLQDLYQKYHPKPVPLPTDKLLREVRPGTEPAVLVACGSFSPPTYMHLRLLEDAKVALESKGKYTVIGGYLSPVHVAYGKASLVENHHRVNLVKAAVANSSWLMVDVFECCQSAWTRTAIVLDNIAQRLSDIPIQGTDKPARVMFNCGADVLQSMNKVKENGETVWIQDHLRIILEENGMAVLEREGTDVQAVIDSSPILSKGKANIEVFHPAVVNDISSTIVRKELKAGSVKYLIPDAVADYIREHDLASKPQWQA